MRLKTRTIAGGLVIVGAVLGTMMSGLFPGFGPGSGIGAQVSGTDTSSQTPTATSDKSPPEVDVEQPSVKPTPPPEVLEVRVDDRDYLIPDENATGFRRADLSEVIKLAQVTKGNDDGIRVRILRSPSARVVTWSTLYDTLEASGLAPDSIRMPKDLLD